MGENVFFGQHQFQRRGETAPTAIGAGTIPVGVPMPWPAATAPTGYLICNGQAVPANCPILASLYGANLPDLRGVVIVGYDAAQAEFNTLLGTGGAKTVTLTEAQIPSHDHTDLGHTHNHNHTGSTVGGDGEHTHTPTGAGSGDWAVRHASATNGLVGSPAEPATFTSMATSGAHGHTLALLHDAEVGVADNQPTGGGGAHTNLQPYRTFNYIVQAA